MSESNSEKGRKTIVKDPKTGEKKEADILTPEEVRRKEKSTPPIELPIPANPPEQPSKN